METLEWAKSGLFHENLLAANTFYFLLPYKLPTPMSSELQIVVAFFK
jgi:hypothetical protein